MNKYLEAHIKKYPKMQIEDKIKLLMQAYLGPGHLVNDYDIVLQRVSTEVENIINQEITTEMIEDISDIYVRVHLLPYYKKYKSFDKLIKAFVDSSNDTKNISQFLEELEELKKTLNDKDVLFLESYIKNKNYLISHSEIYRNTYNPHYLVVNKNYLID